MTAERSRRPTARPAGFTATLAGALLVLLTIWGLTGAGYLWPMWPAWGVVLVLAVGAARTWTATLAVIGGALICGW